MGAEGPTSHGKEGESGAQHGKELRPDHTRYMPS
jgi:hypothetical protein